MKKKYIKHLGKELKWFRKDTILVIGLISIFLFTYLSMMILIISILK